MGNKTGRTIVVEKTGKDGYGAFVAYEKGNPQFYECGPDVRGALGLFLFSQWQRDGNDVELPWSEK